MDKVDYSQIDYLASSPNPEIARLSIIVKNLRERIQSLEEEQTKLADKLHSMQKKSKDTGRSVTAKSRTNKKPSKYSCDLCLAKFSYPSMLQKHRKQAHKAPYNI